MSSLCTFSSRGQSSKSKSSKFRIHVSFRCKSKGEWISPRLKIKDKERGGSVSKGTKNGAHVPNSNNILNPMQGLTFQRKRGENVCESFYYVVLQKVFALVSSDRK